MLSVHTKIILYSVNPCSFVLIHGNELRQIHLITGASHGVNPSLINLLGVCLFMGRIYALLVVKVSIYAHAWKSLVFCYIHGNELRQIHLITGAPHGINP